MKRLYAIISLALLAYTIARAWRLAFVHDEAVTYLLYLLPGRFALLDCYDANNHFLNTILMFLTSLIFGSGEFSLRLPNLAAHAVYLLATFALVRNRFRVLPGLCAFLLLNLNPFVLDFFSLARGYGLALAFTMLGLVFFFRAVRAPWPDTTNLLRSFWCAGLAAFANFTFLNNLVALIGVYLWLDFLAVRKQNAPVPLLQVLRRTRFFYKHILLMLIVFVPLLLCLRRAGALYYGGRTGFWTDTVGSLIQASAYGCSYPAAFTVACIVALALAASGLVFSRRRCQDSPPDDAWIVGLLLAGNAGLIFLQHVAFGAAYPMDRTAIVFLPLFGLLSVLLLEYFMSNPSALIRTAALALLLAAALGMAGHLATRANLRHAWVWKYNADTRAMLKDLEADLRLRHHPGRIRLGISWVFEPSINYDYAVARPSWREPVTREGIAGDYDYFYVLPGDRAQLSGRKVEIVKEYPLTGTVLARKAD